MQTCIPITETEQWQASFASVCETDKSVWTSFPWLTKRSWGCGFKLRKAIVSVLLYYIIIYYIIMLSSYGTFWVSHWIINQWFVQKQWFIQKQNKSLSLSEYFTHSFNWFILKQIHSVTKHMLLCRFRDALQLILPWFCLKLLLLAILFVTCKLLSINKLNNYLQYIGTPYRYR